MNQIVPTSYPLSSGQEAMWLIQQIAPENVAYNIFITAKINFHLKISLVKRVWEKILERHPILKNTYTTHEGKPVQQVNQHQKLNVEVTDASNWSKNHLKEKILAIADCPFNLEKDAVLRVNLFTLSAKEHILVLTMHHIAGDMWSFDLLLSEFRDLYTIEIAQVSQEHTETANDFLTKNKSYIDFIHWQSEMLSSSRGEKQGQYWQKQLAGELPILNLLTDKPRPPVQTYRGASYIKQLDEQLNPKIRNLALAYGTSPYQILLTAFYVLLYRYTNQQDILVGSPMRGRWGKEFKEVVGYFVNLTVLRVAIEENATFDKLLAQVSKTVREAQKHQDYPFSLLAEQLEQQRDPSRPPLCQVSFTWQRQRWCEATENSLHSREQVLEMQPYLLGHQRGADFDLNLMVMEAQGELQLCWQYNTDLFDLSTIERMTGHFVTLLEGIVANAEQQISQLPLLSEVEQQQLLVKWNDTQVDYPQDKCIHQLFEEQVERTPDAVAVVFEHQQLTYEQLNCRANQLAHYLQSVGVGENVLVGLCVERSLEMVVGLLGILKAGGAYVPLDPEYPQDRLRFILEDAQVSVLLTQQHLVEKLPECQAQLVSLDTNWQFISQLPQGNPITNAQASNLAYVIYTSGSTGQPKGVQISHTAVSNFLFAMQQRPGITKQDTLLAITTISFDIAALEIFLPISVGACLVIARRDVTIDGRELFDLLVKSKATIMQATPATWRLLLDSNYQFSDLKILCGGEALPWDLVSKLLARSASLWNLYGPTEATIWSSLCQLESSESLISIGRPISNTQIYILDQNLQPVPVGVPGELHIGGAGLARGYLNRPELTQEKFIPNPFARTKGAGQQGSRGTGAEILPNPQLPVPRPRLYKTGDLARYLPDGNIEYLGRIDNQVKIRGFRIELGEIEAVLSQYPHVQASCAIAREDIPGDKRLVAYIVPQKEQTLTVSVLRSFLKEKLPEYMVPSAIVILKALPLTSNGKLDRRALPAPDLHSQLSDKYFAPRNSIEEVLSGIWAQVLKVERVGIHDNFFELGGHSLLATQIISRIPEAFGTSLPLRSLFKSPTVAQLSEVIASELQTGSSLMLPAILPVSTRQDIPLSWAQERLWFLHHLEGESGAYTMPFAIRLVGNLNIKALEQAIGEMVRRHEVLRTRFEIEHDKPIQVIATDIAITLPVVDLQNVADPWKQVEQLAIKEAYKPFDLAKDPVLRVKMWQVATDEYVLLIAIHHIAADGWSIGVLNRELSAHYRAITTGSAVELPELSVQYADFTLWQRQWLTTQVLEPQLSYWKQQLAAAPPLLELPTDRPRPAIQTFRGGTERFQLDALLTSRLRQLSHKSGTTLFMTLLTGFVVLMSRYSGQTDLVIGSPIANRNRKEIEGLIGFFVNTLALRFDLSPELTLKALLEQVRQVSQNAYDHQDLPFEMLVEELQLERSLDRNPLVQVMFALQNAPTNPWDLPGLKVEKTHWGLEAVRFDLEVHLWEVAEGLEGYCYYSSDLFDAATIARMMKHFQNLLEAICLQHAGANVTNLEQPVSQLPLLTAQERQQLLVEWNATQTDYPADQCIHDLFTAQVAQTPDAVAMVFGQQNLTYQELNAQANQLAHYLQKLGVKPGFLVGICVERSVSMVVGLLAILKAGAAYVPLDTEYPTERLAFIIEDTQISVLLTTQKLTDAIPKHQACVVCFDSDADAIALFSQQNPIAEVTPDNLAYVIYTSGSTGKPKGVAVTHRAVNRLVMNTNYINIEPTDVIAQAANYAFDAATFEIWGALLNGARLVGVSKDLALSPKDFAAFMRSQKISVLFLTTALFNQIAQEVPYAFNSLRHLLFGGEAVDPKWVKEVLENGAPQRLLHVYGPTENTTFSSWYLVQDVPKDATTIPIGQPISNTQIYLLDPQLQPVGVGVPGELYIGGDGLAKEYLNQPELTVQKFIPNPFLRGRGAEEQGGTGGDILPDSPSPLPLIRRGGPTFPSSRLYKTGDKARYLSDGNIEFLGRIDYQVKIRGFRIELGEIETVLSQHPLLQESVVVVREDTPGDKRLVAYLVPALHRQTLPQQVAQWQSEYVNDWQTLYEQLYSQNQTSTDDLTFNIAGWNSSYTRQPIPDLEMQEWVKSTVSRIQANFPQRVLEIGCGTGLLLSRLAKHSQQYWGTDYSIAAIQHVEQICSTVEGLEDVRLLHQMADNFEGIPQGEFDTVVLNSIVQYFPSIEYLLQVLEGAIATITQQGTIFVGDVRSLPLLEQYHAAVQLSQAESDRTIEEWQRMVHQSLAAEEELVIDPGFFIALQTRFPQIGWVEIQPKRGYAQNELTQFRYDVTLHVGTNVQANTVAWLNWQLDKLSLTEIQNQLHKEQPELLGIRRVPNQRVQQALQIWQWLENPPAVETVNQLRQVLAQQPIVGINPEQFYQLGQQLGYSVHLSWWESSQDGCYDVLFCRNSSTQTSDAQAAIAFWDTSAVITKPWTNYSNNPLSGKLVQKLVPQVREYIQQKLPDYMVPQAFVVLNDLPLTPNGKVDRRALPTPDTATRNLSTGFVLPRSPIEAQIAQIWSKILGVEGIGVKDNFFELGGHSLLATQVLSEINSAFGLDLSIQMMFESATVAGIAAYIEVVDLVTHNLSVKEGSTEVVEF